VPTTGDTSPTSRCANARLVVILVGIVSDRLVGIFSAAQQAGATTHVEDRRSGGVFGEGVQQGPVEWLSAQLVTDLSRIAVSHQVVTSTCIGRICHIIRWIGHQLAFRCAADLME
jgi:hypothetical protein